jgi:hypothetical protein
VDKSQVLDLHLIARKFVKNPANWIRCKFSIDGDSRAKAAAPGVHHFETIAGWLWKPVVHHGSRMAVARRAKKPAKTPTLPRGTRALAFV